MDSFRAANEFRPSTVETHQMEVQNPFQKLSDEYLGVDPYSLQPPVLTMADFSHVVNMSNIFGSPNGHPSWRGFPCKPSRTRASNPNPNHQSKLAKGYLRVDSLPERTKSHAKRGSREEGSQSFFLLAFDRASALKSAGVNLL